MSCIRPRENYDTQEAWENLEINKNEQEQTNMIEWFEI